MCNYSQFFHLILSKHNLHGVKYANHKFKNFYKFIRTFKTSVFQSSTILHFLIIYKSAANSVLFCQMFILRFETLRNYLGRCLCFFYAPKCFKYQCN